MALAPRLEIRQTQSLTLTPQLMQSIRLLQFGHLELNAFVAAELEANPLLERDDADTAPPDSEPVEPGTDNSGDLSDSYEHGELIGTARSIAEQYDTEVANIFPEQVREDAQEPGVGGRGNAPSMLGTGDAPDFDNFVASARSLGDHLREQAGFLLRTPADRMIAQHLIDNLDTAGYLVITPDEVAEQAGAEVADVEAVLECLQGCEPAGIFARDLRECLAIQLRERDRLDPLMQKLLDHLGLVAGHSLPALCAAVGAEREDVADMLAELRSLDPRPGLVFDGAPMQAVAPDVHVRRGNDGAWQIELNTEILPKVLVNREYYATVTAKTRDPGEKTFLIDCLQTANWLTRSLDQRAQTILKVAAEIVRQQDAFLEHGVAQLKPMTLKTVAEAIGMHESTVSRVTANKYMATPRGLYELKFFFTAALGSTTGGAEHSAAAVRHRIRQLIEDEPADSILSDDTIAAILKREQGIDVARRTVAKYREGMHIPSSVIRRRRKKAIAEAG